MHFTATSSAVVVAAVAILLCPTALCSGNRRRLQVIEPVHPKKDGIHSLEQAKRVCRDFGLHIANWIEHGQADIFAALTDHLSSAVTISDTSEQTEYTLLSPPPPPLPSMTDFLTQSRPSLWMRFEKDGRDDSPGGMLVSATSKNVQSSLNISFFQNQEASIEEMGKGVLCWGYVQKPEIVKTKAKTMKTAAATTEGRILKENARTTFRVNGKTIGQMHKLDEQRAQVIIESLRKTPMTRTFGEQVIEGGDGGGGYVRRTGVNGANDDYANDDYANDDYDGKYYHKQHYRNSDQKQQQRYIKHQKQHQRHKKH